MKKQKKYSYLLISIVITFCLVKVPATLAVKRAVFPDPRVLQPAPVNVHPNISGNINSSTPNAPSDKETQPQTTGDAVVEQPNSSFDINWLLYLLYFIILVIIVFFIYKSKHKINTEEQAKRRI